ncbi:MAG: DUF3160 domain-containing protein [Methanophagales archaeon]|nr:DUF3160 domain-containing protein [Methanophagales archaeon]
MSETEKARLHSLERILERLIAISKAELENEELTEDDYEFKHPMDDRLTDEKWKEMLETEPPKKAEWVDGIGG